jgi:hypothetical protein
MRKYPILLMTLIFLSSCFNSSTEQLCTLAGKRAHVQLLIKGSDTDEVHARVKEIVTKWQADVGVRFFNYVSCQPN